MSKLHIKKGDTVKVIAGENQKVQEGKVIEVLIAEKQSNCRRRKYGSKHSKPNAANPQGGIVKQEAPIHISNLMLVDPKSGRCYTYRKKKR